MMKPVDTILAQADKKRSSTFDKTISMEELMQRFPHLISVMTRNKLYCAGCFLARFHDISDAAFEHGLDEDELYSDFIAATKDNDGDTA